MANPTRHFVCRVPARTVTGTDWTATHAARKVDRKATSVLRTVTVPAEVWLRSSSSRSYSSASPVQGSHDIVWHRDDSSRRGPYEVIEVAKATAEGIRAYIQQQHNKPSPGPSLSYVDARHCDTFMVRACLFDPTQENTP